MSMSIPRRRSMNAVELLQLERVTAPEEIAAARRVVTEHVDGDPSEVLAMLGLDGGEAER